MRRHSELLFLSLYTLSFSYSTRTPHNASSEYRARHQSGCGSFSLIVLGCNNFMGSYAGSPGTRERDVYRSSGWFVTLLQVS